MIAEKTTQRQELHMLDVIDVAFHRKMIRATRAIVDVCSDEGEYLDEDDE